MLHSGFPARICANLGPEWKDFPDVALAVDDAVQADPQITAGGLVPNESRPVAEASIRRVLLRGFINAALKLKRSDFDLSRATKARKYKTAAA